VRLYTWGLPEDLASTRRDELESDLVEHSLDAQRGHVSASRLNAEILARVLVGIPADLSWRHATRQPRRLTLAGTVRSLSPAASNRLLNVLGALVIAHVWFWTVGAAVLFEPNPDDEPSRLLGLVFLVVPLTSSVALAVGLRIRERAPRPARYLVVIGAIGPGVWLWFLPIYLPFMVAIVVLAVATTPRSRVDLEPA
jgi:hypothetical protein